MKNVAQLSISQNLIESLLHHNSGFDSQESHSICKRDYVYNFQQRLMWACHGRVVTCVSSLIVRESNKTRLLCFNRNNMNRCDSFAHLFPKTGIIFQDSPPIQPTCEFGAKIWIKPVRETSYKCQQIEGWIFIARTRQDLLRTSLFCGVFSSLLWDLLLSFVGHSQSRQGGNCQAPFYRCPPDCISSRTSVQSNLQI